MKTNLKSLPALSVSILALGSADLALAQSAPARADAAEEQVLARDPTSSNEIIVTANRREERLQDVPVAVTALGGASLERLQVRDVFDLNRTVPNLIVTEAAGASTSPGIVIRGIGLIDATWNVESGVGVYVDDAYVSGQIGNAFDLIDIERIEVLRGPQGTLYGRNSTSGAVKIVVRRPDLDEFDFKGDVTYGSRDEMFARASVSIPIAKDTLALKVDALARDQDGYVFNRTFNDDVYGQSRFFYRAAALWQPSEAFEAYLIGTYGVESSDISLSTPTRYDHATDRHIPTFGRNIGESGTGVRNVNDNTSASANLQLSYNTGIGTLKSITSYRKVNSDLSGDLDGRGTGIPLPSGTGFLNIDFDQRYEDRLLTQEIQLVNSVGPVDFATGVFYFERDTFQDTWTKLFFPTGMRQVADQKARSYAAYVDLTWTVAPAIDLFGGVRYTHEKKTVDHVGAIALQTGIATPFNPTPFPGGTLFNFLDRSATWKDLSHRFGVKYRVTDDVMVYTSRSRGFKPGQIAAARGPDPVNSGRFTKKETATTYELGLRSQLLDRTVLLNVTGFFEQYRNFAAVALSSANLSTTTVDVDIYGFELETNWRTPLEGLNINASTGLTKSDFEFPNLVLKDAPEVTAQVGLTYETPPREGPTFGFGTTAFHQSKVYFANINRNEARKQKAYTTVDGQVYVQSETGQLRLTAAVRNIFDKKFANLGNELFDLPPSVQPQPFAQRYYNPGRTWRLTLRYTM